MEFNICSKQRNEYTTIISKSHQISKQIVVFVQLGVVDLVALHIVQQCVIICHRAMPLLFLKIKQRGGMFIGLIVLRQLPFAPHRVIVYVMELLQ